MRIHFIGDFSSNLLDEGVKNVAHYLSNELSKYHDVTRQNVWKIYSGESLKLMRHAHPQVVHYITGPTFKSFLLLVAIKLYWRDAKIVMSALHPYSSSLLRTPVLNKIISFIKPDLILVQSDETGKAFNKLGFKTRFLPNGVDNTKMVPVPRDVKTELRKKHGVDPDKFVILHVGHLTKNRSLNVLSKIQGNGNQVIVVASTHFKVDKEIYRNLEQTGCIIWKSYLSNLEEIYALSDCYIFPVASGNSILIPLSVLEAMSCNLPVISTKFEQLPALFQEDDSLIFADKEEDFVQGLERIKNGVEVKNRERVLPYSWEKISSELEGIYQELIS